MKVGQQIKMGPSIKKLLVSVGFWAMFFLLLYLRYDIEYRIGFFVDVVRSEYRVVEQLSKFYLLCMLFVALYTYQIMPISDTNGIKISLGFFALAQTLYLAESNMISEVAQPIFAALILLPLFYWLMRQRSWLTMIIVVMGFSIVAVGVTVDFFHDNEEIQQYLSEPAIAFAERIPEETVDVVAIAVIVWAVLLHFYEPLEKLASKNIKSIAGFLIGIGLLTVGNSFLHWGYRPSDVLRSVAFIISFAGLVVIYVINRSQLSENERIRFGNEDQLYGYLFVFFAFLPLYFAFSKTLVSLIAMLPLTVGLTLYLYRYRANSTHS